MAIKTVIGPFYKIDGNYYYSSIHAWCLLSDLLFSMFAFCWAWGMAPKCNKPFGSASNTITYLLGITLGIFLWISLFLPLLDGVVVWMNGNSLLLIYISLVGAYPYSRISYNRALRT